SRTTDTKGNPIATQSKERSRAPAAYGQTPWKAGRSFYRSWRVRCGLRVHGPGLAPSASLVGATRGTISLGQEGEFKGAEYSEFRNPSVSGSLLDVKNGKRGGSGSNVHS